MSSKEIVRELVSDASLLIQRQVKLARLEAGAQMTSEKKAASLMGAGGAVAYAAVIILLIAAALAIGQAIGALWSGALIVGGALLFAAAIVGGVGWAQREKKALPRTRRELDKEMSWAKQLTT